jgi:hypothetical protein
VRVLLVVFEAGTLAPAVGSDVKDIALSQVQLPMLGLAKTLSRSHDLVEYRLQPLATRDSSQHLPDRLPLITKALKLLGQPRLAQRSPLVHGRTLRWKASRFGNIG